MKVHFTAFYGTAIKLSLRDLAALIFGKTIDISGIKVALNRMPKTGCPCGCESKRGA